MWRIGRNLYCRARNEVVVNNIATNGEPYVQACVIKGVEEGAKSPLTVFDVGANLGEWTGYLLEQLPQERVSETRVFLFEPIAATKEKLIHNIDGMTNSHVAQVFPYAMSNAVGNAEMVVLNPALEPATGSSKLAGILNISQGEDGFFCEKEPDLTSVATAKDGIFIAGCAQGPKDIAEAVAEAGAAVGRILSRSRSSLSR